mgnify:CR=1 FL=1
MSACLTFPPGPGSTPAAGSSLMSSQAASLRALTRQTIAAYDDEAQAYAEATRHLQVPDRDVFLSFLPEASHILDAGCGSGRDALAFLESGHTVEAFDGSSALAEQARLLTGLDVTTTRFQDYSAHSTFDGVWAMASLLHVPRSELDDCFDRLVAALKPGGHLFCCFKDGHADRVDRGRHFTDMSPAALKQLCARSDLVPVRLWSSFSGRLGAEVKWNNMVAWKPNF